jgi:phosphatidylglycerol:prolipoprotein diacylglycerol transferase
MHPRLIEIPYIHLTIWSFGPMMAFGFLMGLGLVRRLSRRAGLDWAAMLNAAMYCLIIGVVGARVFFVIHHFDLFRGNLPDVVAIWRGGLEFIGGVVPAIGLLLFYLHRHRQPIRRYLDVMAVGLMVGLAFGRIGCFLNGCCFGKPTDLPWAVRFPYRSYAYYSQVNANPLRNRPVAQLQLPPDYLSSVGEDGTSYLKPYEGLTDEQRDEVTTGKYRCLPVQPTQLYSSAGALLMCLMLYLFWKKAQDIERSAPSGRFLAKPGQTFSLALVMYGIGRFLIELLRDDNPFEIGSMTVSQIMGLVMFASGLVLLMALMTTRSDTFCRRISESEYKEHKP